MDKGDVISLDAMLSSTATDLTNSLVVDEQMNVEVPVTLDSVSGLYFGNVTQYYKITKRSIVPLVLALSNFQGFSATATQRALPMLDLSDVDFSIDGRVDIRAYRDRVTIDYIWPNSDYRYITIFIIKSKNG